MALRRPILLFSIITLVLGVSFDFIQPLPRRLNVIRCSKCSDEWFVPSSEREAQPLCHNTRCKRLLACLSPKENRHANTADLPRGKMDRTFFKKLDQPHQKNSSADGSAGQIAEDDDSGGSKFLQEFQNMQSVACGRSILMMTRCDQLSDAPAPQPYQCCHSLHPTAAKELVASAGNGICECIEIFQQFCNEHVPNSDQESQSESGTRLSLISICLAVILAKNDDLKRKIPLVLSLSNQIDNSATWKTFFGILLAALTNQPQTDALGRYLETNAGKPVFAHNPDHHVPKPEGKRKPATGKSNHLAIGPVRKKTAHESPADKITGDEKEDSRGPLCSKNGSWHEFSSSFFQNLRPMVNAVFPMSFLPSAGSSPADIMSHLGSRLASLYSLPTSCSISRTRLAQAGFYYDTTKKDRNASNAHEVACYSCGLTYGQWKDSDNPIAIHLGLKPDCDHAKAEAGTVGNLTPLRVTLPTTANQPPSSFPSLLSLDSGISSMASAQSLNSSRTSLSSGRGSMALSEAGSLNSVMSVGDSGLGGDSVSSMTSEMRGAATVMSSDRTYSDGAAAARSVGLGDLETDACAILPQPTATVPVRNAPPQPAATVTRPAVTNRDQQRQVPTTTPASAWVADEHPPLNLGSAVYPQFSQQQDRLKTFTKWPLGDVFRPQDMVMQGLYYAGYADCLRCFYCGVGLKSWDRGDDVMTEHIRYRPSCGYLLNIKGRRFVDGVLQRLQPPAPAPSATAPRPASAVTAPRSSATSSSNAGGNTGDVGSAVLREVESMGFSKDLITKAISLLRQNSPGSNITTAALVDKILETDTSTSQASPSQGAPNNPTPKNGLERNGLADDAEPEEESEYTEVLRENERLKSRSTCVICHEARVGIIFLPCGHVNACAGCGNKTKYCTTCKKHIKATANVFMS